jgi:hypothetical protein
MADALYQLLALIDTTPMEHTEVWNIIQRHANTTDGYAALYEIMERIHPLLNPDAKLQAPMSINCTDIHDYSNQINSYFLYNSLENVHFTQRQQINIFLKGDSSYATTIWKTTTAMTMAWRWHKTTLRSSLQCPSTHHWDHDAGRDGHANSQGHAQAQCHTT